MIELKGTRKKDIQLLEDYELRREKLLKVILQHLDRTNKVSMLYTTALDLLYLKVALQREVPDIQEVLNLAAKAIETCFLFATQRVSENHFVFRGRTISIKKNEKFNPANYTEDIDFINAIYLAMLSNRVDVTQLTTIKMEELIFSKNKTDAFFKHYGNFLKNIVKGDKSAGDRLTETFEGTFPGQLKYGIPDYFEHNMVEHLKVWRALLGRDIRLFNKSMQSALQKHHTYWSKEQPYLKGRLAPNEELEGCFSLALTAIGKFAKDNSFSIEVKSDYLPIFLMDF